MINIYLFMALVIFFAGLLTYSNKKNIFLLSKAYMVVSCILLFGPLALRGAEVGSDTLTYLRYFEAVKNLSWGEVIRESFGIQGYSMELGYMLLEKLVGSIFISNQWILIVGAAIFMYGIYKLLYTLTNNKMISLCSFMASGAYLLSYNVMRQSIAVGLCCLSFCYLAQKKTKISAIFYFIAITFHTSAIFFGVIYIIQRLVMSKKTIATLGIVAILFGVAGRNVLSWVLKNFFPGYYYNYGQGKWGIGSAGGIIFFWGIIAVLIIMITLKTDWKNKDNRLIFQILILCMIYLSISILGQSFDGLQRLAMYFEPFLPLLLERGEYYFDRWARQIYIVGVSVCCLAFYVMAAGSTEYTPYTFFWQ